MAKLTAEQWEQAKLLFDHVVDLPPAARSAHLATLDDQDVMAEVHSLLAASERTMGFFDAVPSIEGLVELGDLDPGCRIGSWRVVRTIGRGGMGTVYEAARAEGGFDQRAALKVIAVEADRWRARFEDERQIVARLDHPGIARVFDGGFDADGHPYMAMEFITGSPMTAYATDHVLGLDARLALFGQVCDAVAYAQRALVVHLDLKPGNIFVTPDGAVKLLDFGAARVLGAGLDKGAAAAMLTPAYASPEQRAGRAVTTATDVYGLGVLLFELLTGSLPAPADSATPAPVPSAVAAGRADAPVPAARIAGDLDAIVAKAMQVDPADRYANAGALGADIGRARRGDPVIARNGGAGYVAGRMLRRYRWPVAAAGALVLSLAGGVVATTLQARHAIAERDHLEAEVARSNAVLDYFQLMFRTAGDDADGRPVLAQDILARSTANLNQSFADAPAKYGRVVEFLATLYSELSDPTAAEPLARRYLASPAARADTPSASRVRLLLAEALVREGKPDDAADMLAQAQHYWLGDPGNHAGDLARSRIVEGQILKAHKDVPAAITALRRGLHEADLPDADVPAEDVSNLRNSLALALMADGQFAEAERLMADVRAYREKEGRTNDYLLVAIQNQGAIALAEGQLPRAEALLRQSIDARQRKFGPSGALAAAEVALAKTLLLQGRPAEAGKFAADAASVGLKYTGPKSPLTKAGKVLTAMAAVETGDSSAAAKTAAALAATAAASDALRALALATDARLLGAEGQAGNAARQAALARAMLDDTGKTGLQLRPLLDQLLKG